MGFVFEIFGAYFQMLPLLMFCKDASLLLLGCVFICTCVSVEKLVGFYSGTNAGGTQRVRVRVCVW